MIDFREVGKSRRVITLRYHASIVPLPRWEKKKGNLFEGLCGEFSLDKSALGVICLLSRLHRYTAMNFCILSSVLQPAQKVIEHRPLYPSYCILFGNSQRADEFSATFLSTAVRI